MSNYVVIPTYNEASNIRQLLNLLKTMNVQVIVVDDNSPDGTNQIVKSEYPDIVCQVRQNKQGIGSACKEGIKIALEDKHCQNVITIDSDLSHYPLDILKLLESNADIVIGSRYIKDGNIVGWNLYRKLTSKCANIMCKLLLRTGVNDNTGNFRKYSRECARNCLDVQGNNYEWVIGSLVANIRLGHTVEEVPITFTNRTKGKSKLKNTDILNWIKFIIVKAIKR
jgi:dolichol-phosphate mannosyltransferase